MDFYVCACCVHMRLYGDMEESYIYKHTNMDFYVCVCVCVFIRDFMATWKSKYGEGKRKMQRNGVVWLFKLLHDS